MAFAPANAFCVLRRPGTGERAPGPSLFRQARSSVMALKVELKPNERILIGESVITNCDQRSWLVIEGSSPILREKDILTARKADTPAKRIYLAVQLMYTSRDPRAHHEIYFSLVKQIVQAAPSTWQFIEVINNQILTGNLYKALKEAKKLIVYEEGLLANAKCSANLQKRGKANLKSA
jgi:flagellar protein FlbT